MRKSCKNKTAERILNIINGIGLELSNEIYSHREEKMPALTINELVAECTDTAGKHGFHDHDYWYYDHNDEGQNPGVPARLEASWLALIHSEVSEACEALRTGDKENFAEEMADIVIRVADICGNLGIDLEKELLRKMRKNKDREVMHGGKLF